MKHEKRKARIQILPPFLFWSRTTLRCACAPLFARSWPAFAFIVICELTASAAPIFEQKNSKEKKVPLIPAPRRANLFGGSANF